MKSVVRVSLTIAFGALPASMLLLLAASVLGPGLLRGGDVIPNLAVVCLLVFAALGTVGLWRATLQRQFTSWLNACFLLAGMLALAPIVIFAIEKDPMWLLPRGTNKDSFEALLVLGPFVTAFAYLVAMGVRRFSSGSPSETDIQ